MSSDKDYLQEYDNASEAEKYLLVQEWIRTEHRLPFFKQLRAQRPVLETPECTLVANFVDVRDMLQMPKIFTVDLYKPKMSVTGPDDGYLMAHDDNALHYREKSLMQGLLNRDDLPRVRKMVATTAAKILKKADGQIEYVNDFCRAVPVALVQEYFGLDGVNKKDLIRWSYWNQYDAFNNQPFDMLSETEERQIIQYHDKASEELVMYIGKLMARKILTAKILGVFDFIVRPLKKVIYPLLDKPIPDLHDNMVERMVKTHFASSADFNLIRLGTNAGGLLIGAIETTSQAVSQVVEYFINHPELLAEAKTLAKQNEVKAFDNMVWEALRYVPIRPDIFRKCAEDYTMGKGTDYQTTIKKGTIVRLLTHSAMFDPFAYENPDEFNPDRNFYHNFVFGYGPHQCLGKYVGMEMIPEMVKQTLLMDNLSSDDKISYINDKFPERHGPFPEKYHIQWAN